METIELNLSRTQLEAIFYGLKALTDSMATTLANTPASSNTYIETNRHIQNVITSLASNTRLDANTDKSTLPRSNTSSDATTNKDTLIRDNTSSASASNNINNNNINNTVVVDDDEETNIVVNNTNTYIDTGVPSLEEITEYVNVHKYRMSPQKFYDYYKRRNWKTKGGVSIVGQWKGFVDNWAKNEFAPKQQAGNTGTVEERRAAHKFVPTTFE